ncbi:MAG: 6-carboxytetrahydropterin synthase [Bacteroidia bacterium]|nr:6-carboxytetrahydropterin synthase [Bacteroidia bacterium]
MSINRPRTLYITRKEHFNAAHKLYNPTWDKEHNESVFGKCANEYWHGHNFDLYVTIKGIPNPDTGFIIDLKYLKKLINTNIIDKLDHKNLNTDVDFLSGILPSIENVSVAIWDILSPLLPENCSLHKITLYETERNFVEYRGE